MLERHHATELMWGGCLLGKDNVKRGKEGGQWPLGIGAAGEKRKKDRERERGRER